MTMNGKRSNRGFTMMEMLIAVGILVILMALGFIAVASYQRSMKQLELDRTAQEIYVAAQNHLTQAEAEGVLKRRVGEEAIGETHERGSDDKKVEYHYFYVTPEDTRLKNPSQTVLYDMLPAFSLEDVVRLGGSYVIEYDLDSATVTNVFYSDQSNLSTYTFSSSDYKALFENPDLTKPEAAKNRLDGTNTNGQVIGWFGGEEAKNLTRTRLYAPKVEIVNGDRLEVKVSFATGAISRMTNRISPKIQVFVEGKTSGSKRLVTEESLEEFKVNQSRLEIKDGIGYRTKTYVLDDVTQEGKHFYDLWCASGDNKLQLGEYVTAQAKVSSNSMLANIAYSPVSNEENSLYQKLEVADGSAVAGVTSFRHLENLDPAISGLTKDLRAALGLPEQFRAVQRENLTWADFKANTGGEKTQIHLIGTPTTKSAEGTYLPVTNDGLVGYDGESLYVDGVKVDVAGAAGMFGTLTNCAIRNLELRNFVVSSSGSDTAAGALAGTLAGASSVTGVIAKETGGATSRISGAGAGGLVGLLSDTSTVDASAAAVYVSASGADGTVAGGLVAMAASGTTIRNSYAGGHTKEGLYDPDDFNVTATASRGNATAGGLVGATYGATTIENCYATTSVSSTNIAGGLVGTMSGTVSNCYATGLVRGTAGSAGAFLGSAGTVTSTGNTYYSIVNPDVPAVGGGTEVGNVTAFDENTDTYKAYIAGHASPAATPYDATLATRYNNVYPFKSVKELKPAAPTPTLNITSTHVGDWPAMETIVVNVKSSS